MVSRRELLKLGVTAAVSAVLTGVAMHAYYVGLEAEVEKLREKLKEAVAISRVPKMKVGFIYVGPIGDFGWTFGHERNRLYLEERLGPLVETYYIESVPEPEVGARIDELVGKGCKLIFTTSFGYMPGTQEAAARYRDVFFAHCSGYLSKKTPPNMIEYFIDLYEAYYLCGILAGAMTRTNRVGYVPAHLIPEVIRHINAFTIGVLEGASLVGKDPDKVEVIVARPLGAWYAPDKAREAAESLIAMGCDVLAFTEDSPSVLQTAERHWERGEWVWSFSHYSDMHAYGPHACLSGQLVNWGPLVTEIAIRAMTVWLMSEVYKIARLEDAIRLWTDWPTESPRDYWWSMHKSAYYTYVYGVGKRVFELKLDVSFRRIKTRGGVEVYEPINPVDIYPINPRVPERVRRYVLKRREQIMLNKIDPFGPPIRNMETGRVILEDIVSENGRIIVRAGERLSKDELYSMSVFVKGVKRL